MDKHVKMFFKYASALDYEEKYFLHF